MPEADAPASLYELLLAHPYAWLSAICVLGLGVLYRRNVALSDSRLSTVTKVTEVLAAAAERERAIVEAVTTQSQATRELGAVIGKHENVLERLTREVDRMRGIHDHGPRRDS